MCMVKDYPYSRSCISRDARGNVFGLSESQWKHKILAIAVYGATGNGYAISFASKCVSINVIRQWASVIN